MPLLWEQLVTDGHVRAARLRFLAPWVILVGVVSLACGWLVLNGVPQAGQFFSTAENTLNQRAYQVRQPVLNTFSRAYALNASPSQVSQLVPESELPAVYKAVSDGVATGSFPAGFAMKQAAGAAEFWSWNWPYDQLIALERGDLRAYGAIVYAKGPAGQPDLARLQGFPRPVRWLAIFRKLPDGWDNVAIQGDGFTAPPGEKTVVPGQIPLVLCQLMDMPGVTR